MLGKWKVVALMGENYYRIININPVVKLGNWCIKTPGEEEGPSYSDDFLFAYYTITYQYT